MISTYKFSPLPNVENFYGSAFFQNLGVIFSSIPNSNFAVLDSELNFKSIGGEQFSLIFKEENQIRDISTLQNYLGTSEIDFETFRSAWNGESFVKEMRNENKILSVKITSVRLSLEKTPLRSSLVEQQFLLFSVVESFDSSHREKIESELFQKQSQVIGHEENLYKEIIEIFNWRKEIHGKGNHKLWLHKALPNLNTCLMQGAGLGVLTTSLGSMIRKSVKKEKHVEIPLNHFNLIEENFRSTKKLIKTLASAQLIFEDSSTPEDIVSLQNLKSIVEEEKNFLSRMLAIKQQTILVSALNDSAFAQISIHEKNFRSVIRELFTNAMKYSPERSSIIVLFLKNQTHFILKVINSTNDPHIHNLDFKHSEENILFEPFYRLNRAVDERYDEEEFGLGLGLSVVRKILEDMKGNIHISLLPSNLFNQGNEVCMSLEFLIHTKEATHER
ncbi:sensor histidine kinase [Leptospira idonii]|uniref:histidine kinase n=1 Tax=Leptospira idonii TaxID=1193500 RepID=A0A4R9LZR5_9LEPT|nr:ATP-binding protein [Leptospira idonii]TGN19262.1 ATP-binding protein [Leptospira idonii]